MCKESPLAEHLGRMWLGQTLFHFLRSHQHPQMFVLVLFLMIVSEHSLVASSSAS